MSEVNYFKSLMESTVIYVVVYDIYCYGCSQARFEAQKTFKSVEEADAYRIEHYYSQTLIHRSIYSRLSNGGWDEQHYTNRPTKPIDMTPIENWLEATKEEREERNREAMKNFNDYLERRKAEKNGAK